MKLSAGFIVATAIAVGGTLIAGCQNGVVGPSLSAVYTDVTLQPTVAGLVGGENVCCCHLAGRVTNTSSIPVDAEVRFTAKGTDGALLGTATDILTNIPSGGSRQFLAVGLPHACRNISLPQILADGQIRLKGLWTPPN
jgi:hypothetical protein